MTYLLTRSERGLISREQVLMKLGMFMFICTPLSRRAMQLSQLTLTLAMFFTLYHDWKGLGFKKGVSVWYPMPWVSCPGVSLVESPFLPGSGIPSLAMSSLCGLNLIPFWPISPMDNPWWNDLGCCSGSSVSLLVVHPSQFWQGIPWIPQSCHTGHQDPHYQCLPQH